ncbi:MAG: M48 family metallopeptidase [Clostridiales bacterium]|jgi:predicted metal-dependent hydrolase|nr:M48 family metallopeptidase [Clostridiales bacterium]
MTEYTLTRSRRKTLAIHIKTDGAVEVRAPLRLAKSEIERFVKLKSQWIESKQTQISLRQPAELRELPPSKYAPGEFERAASEIIKIWEQRLDVTASFVGFRAMSSRWGSCTSKTRRIRINTALAHCPKECLEYVIVHELAHLRENNHSPNFWKIVAKALPDYKLRQTKLKELAWLLNAQGGK